MSFLEMGRRACFWAMDAVKGSPVKKELEILENLNSQVQDDDFENRTDVKKLLEHAVSTTDFYSHFDATDLSSFPLITKATLKENYEQFLSSSFDKDSLFRMTTSGSTGTPFTCLQDYRKKKATYAEVLYYNGMIGYSIGKKIIYLRSVVEECSKTPIQQFMQNIYLVDCNDLSDEGIERMLTRIASLTKREPAMMMGYASTLDAFRDYFTRNDNRLAKQAHIYGVISGSEMLFDDTRKAIEQAFSCTCLSRYANEENGFLGQDLYRPNEFVIDNAHYVYEIVDFDSDKPSPKGQVGRIVVTDLRNYAMPMIRYDTGDVGRLENRTFRDKHYTALVDFGGRKVDVIYDCNGQKISPHAITNLMWKFTGINQYQLIQKDKGSYLLKINVPDSFSFNEELEHDLMHVLGIGANLQVERVDEIPVLSSRKRKYIVNECN
ncbi:MULTISPECIES: phenylacetate--CoA ligase family protein [unclassified Collinsella]|uniref:phenylacetate--CoA ligase family protein n=1 Tax=unclassified Collinsella TaxID=2637548 RepID=UPI0012B2AC38|nr:MULTISPECIES: phenylacetate--CoA ligase family protein [unclassified Collinsella]MSS26188.1 phenylacetate--CoA ligase family protein [Collinsella sp. WCA1-178-WT-3 (M2)]MSS52337.1 phenylacetate--CoA ligase family protein [Collinsella sp. WCA1-178-WT-3 (M1)]